MPSEEEKCIAVDNYSLSKYDRYYDNEKAKHFEAGWDACRNRME